MPGLQRSVLIAPTRVDRISGCNPRDDGNHNSPDGDIVAKPGGVELAAVVNGHPITGADLRAHAGMDAGADRIESDDLLEEQVSLEP